jgi:regulator of CtrA degradation
MSDQVNRGSRLVSFGEKLAASANFSALFREGMDLIEETAAYLDGKGRSDAKVLDRGASLTYATESMRLTTRLMQLASWLLLHRAVKEGEMTLAQANREKSKVKLNAPEPGSPDTLAQLPQALQDLISRSTDLQGKVRRLDTTMHAVPPAKAEAGPNAVASQMGQLKAAFEQPVTLVMKP